ncbi:MAG TPA: plastocyanin/azurin family copper-binding protein [Opitutales bacterium]|nr:plastocyanin/azurin family copper-binding protein [Opitutales bacterium]
MKTIRAILASLSLAAAAVFLTGCSDGPATTATAAPKAPEIKVIDGPITITGDDLMKFNVTEFAVKAGSEVKIIFKHIGKMPKEAMGHNLVVLEKGMNPIEFAGASVRFPRDEYISPDLKDSVIAFTRVLGPGEEQTITFTAPSEAGDYPFVCSFPGHTPAGMRGVMKVK